MISKSNCLFFAFICKKIKWEKLVKMFKKITTLHVFKEQLKSEYMMEYSDFFTMHLCILSVSRCCWLTLLKFNAGLNQNTCRNAY